MKTPFFSWLAALLVLFFLSHSTAFSCPVCFGALDDPSTDGLKVAIFTLLGVTGSVLAGLISFFLRLRKLSRSAAMERGEP